MQKVSGVYAIRCGDRVYIGSSRNVYERLQQHRHALERGRHPRRQMQGDWDVNGPDAFIFELVEETPPDDRSLDAAENRHILATGDLTYNYERRALRWADGRQGSAVPASDPAAMEHQRRAHEVLLPYYWRLWVVEGHIRLRELQMFGPPSDGEQELLLDAFLSPLVPKPHMGRLTDEFLASVLAGQERRLARLVDVEGAPTSQTCACPHCGHPLLGGVAT